MKSVLPKLIALLAFAGVAQAQWNTNSVTWTAPTTCTSGQPVANCAVTGYRVERSATQNGTYAPVGTSPASPFTHNGAAAGQNCYRIVALSAQGDSTPSVVTSLSCKTNVEPSGPPNPPTDVRAVSTVVWNVKPNLQRFTFERGPVVNAVTVKMQAACDESRCVTGGYCVVENLRSVSPRPATGTVLLAKCA